MDSLLMYPLAPEGTPYRMKAQEFAFNGDTFLAEEFLRLKKQYGLEHVIETGSYIGTTTLWFARHFDAFDTAEIDTKYHAITEKRLWDAGQMAQAWNETGCSVLRDVLSYSNHDRTILFLDAHALSGTGVGYGVLIEELMTIAAVGAKPKVIVMHDMQVPGHPEFQFDHHGTEPFTLEWVAPHLDAIYGAGGWSHYWNEKATGAMVGVLFVVRNEEIIEPIVNPVA